MLQLVSTDSVLNDPRSSDPEIVAIVGMGYVGLPTSLGLHSSGITTIGIDVSGERLEAIRNGTVDLVEADHLRLERARSDDGFRLTCDSSRIGAADTVIVCVPTPLDRHLTPDLGPLRSACQALVEHARPGQTFILTSTSFVGTTQELLVKPLEERGFTIGEDVFVAFSPERIDPGNVSHVQAETPRVVGGFTAACADRARATLERLTPTICAVSSVEAAELTKLYENSFRAVNIALANEFADICGALSLNPIEVTMAAATKPYGFLASFPGPGVGGHCIPCDPHYLLWQLREINHSAPLVQEAMTLISNRPKQVVDRAVQVFSDAGRGMSGARLLVVGVSYKAGVRDLRESSAVGIIAGLENRGAKVEYYDPLVDEMALPGGRLLRSFQEPHGADFDIVLVHTVHPGHDYDWVRQCPIVLDATYRFHPAPHRQVV